MKACLEKKDLEQLPKNFMLVDYYHASVADVDDGGYFELVMSSCEDFEKVRLDRYTKDCEGADEVKTSFLVPINAFHRCMELIEEHSLSSWDDMTDTVILDGVKLVCKFWDGEKHIRVSSDHMPQDGAEIMTAIRDVMNDYTRKEFLI